jgi:hypothetical protein
MVLRHLAALNYQQLQDLRCFAQTMSIFPFLIQAWKLLVMLHWESAIGAHLYDMTKDGEPFHRLGAKIKLAWTDPLN